MTMHSALAAAATLVSLAFAACTLERWLDRRRAHELAWSIALLLFAGGAAALWWGAAAGWTAASFRVFYALGAVVNVPVLALGTVLLLARPAVGRAAAIGVGLGCAFALGIVLAAPLRSPIPPDGLPRGSEVFGALPRVLAAVSSSTGAVVLLGGAILSAGRLLLRRGPYRLVAANVCIALGTLILAAGGLLNSVVDEMDGFAITLVAGIAVLFGGFLLTAPRTTAAAPTVGPPAALPAVRLPDAAAAVRVTQAAPPTA